MNANNAERRRAVTGWRDQESVAVTRLFYSAAAATTKDLERLAGEARWRDALFDLDNFTRPRVDRAMRDRTEASFGHWLCDASDRLRLLDPEFEDLALSLTAKASPLLPVIEAMTTRSDESSADRPTRRTSNKLTRSWMMQQAGSLAGRASSSARQIIDSGIAQARVLARFGPKLQDSALALLHARWIGELGEPQPVLAQVLAGIDLVATEAREILA